MHAFWTIDDEPQRSRELVNFTKNLALSGGGALAAAVPESWPAGARSGNHALAARRGYEDPARD
jgi:predicted outer membrane repeat protein